MCELQLPLANSIAIISQQTGLVSGLTLVKQKVFERMLYLSCFQSKRQWNMGGDTAQNLVLLSPPQLEFP